VSNNDSFIEEVTEEVRRDKLFALMRRYGWIAILAVVLLVGGAAYNEWRKARNTAAAEALGDALISALDETDPAARLAALEKIDAKGDARIVVALMQASAAQTAGQPETAEKLLQSIVNDSTAPQIYRDMAQLKTVMMLGPDMDKDRRLEALKSLDVAGAPYRLLAEEQLAVIDIENGDKKAAIARLQDIYADSEASAAMRQRISQLIVALGGELETS